ncbi:MAG TPA: DUF1287 domain-containing protein [Syntrophomonadaceae bacterium]|nr:DUF1287 domain-containing protein [Syntrophomonadaceae bacterium]
MNYRKGSHVAGKTSKKKYVRTIAAIIMLLAVGIGCWWWIKMGKMNSNNVLYPDPRISLSPIEKIPSNQLRTPDLIVLGARQEVARNTMYDGSYQVLSYPKGDVPLGWGACTDVVIRALRNAGIDLQELIHQDMTKSFSAYPQQWGTRAPDSNIDHRRVPNQMCFLKRHGQTLSTMVAGHLDQWHWGDIVYWRFPNGLEHCGIVSDRKTEEGIPLVIENSSKAQEADLLQYWEIIGHFRYPPD